MIFVFYKKENACPCGYCEFFKYIEYEKDGLIIQKGICRKHDLLRNTNDQLCDDFILMPGTHTKKWYPNKKT